MLRSMRRFLSDVDLQIAAASALLNLAQNRGDIITEVVTLKGLEQIVVSMRCHPFHAGLQQQFCRLLLVMAQLGVDVESTEATSDRCHVDIGATVLDSVRERQREECARQMLRAQVAEAVKEAIQRDMLCEMRMSLQCARELLRILFRFAPPRSAVHAGTDSGSRHVR